MSIAINTHRTQTAARRFATDIPAERSVCSRDQQLQEARGLMRHFVLAFVAAGAALYGAAAVGLMGLMF